MADVHYPDETRLRAAGFASVVHVPTLFGRSGGPRPKRFYCVEYNRYLRERALLEWMPGGTTAGELARAGRRLSYHTRKSLIDYAERLANFDEWLVTTNRDWRSVRYTEEIVFGYQADMLSGRWAKLGRRLKNSTVCARVSEACCFLRWASERGLRGPFRVTASSVRINVQSGISSRGGQGLVVQSRAGAPPREAETLLSIPTAKGIAAWLHSVRVRRGHAKELMCRLALGGGLRLSELTGFRFGDLPDLDTASWHVVGDKMRLTLLHGTKGRRFDPVDSPEIGPQRTIWIPVDLAQELLSYRSLRRLRAANLFRKRVGRLPNRPSDYFFLGDHDGTPIAPDTLYRAWKTEPTPMAGWHPHSARDYWACTTLLAELGRQTQAVPKTLADMPHAWVEEVGRTTIDTVIRPQLGHLSLETTLRYLKWLGQTCTLVDTYVGWAAYLESADG